jgi:hypothetical protein
MRSAPCAATPAPKAYQEFMAANEGKTILSEREHDDAATMAAIVRADPVAGSSHPQPRRPRGSVAPVG